MVYLSKTVSYREQTLLTPRINGEQWTIHVFQCAYKSVIEHNIEE